MSSEALSAKVFIALIVRNRIYNPLKEKMLRTETNPKYMTASAALRELEKIELVMRSNGRYRLDHAVTQKQKAILSAFRIPDEDISAIAVEIVDLLDNSRSLIDSEPTEEEDDDGEDTYDIFD